MAKRGSGKSRFGSGKSASGRTVDEGNARVVVIRDARCKNGAQTIDCSHLFVAPSIAREFVKVLPRVLTKRNTERTRKHIVESLRYGFFHFLAAKQRSSIELSDINQELVDEFVSHLRNATGDDNKPQYELSTRRHYLSALRAVLSVLKNNGAIADGDLVVPELETPEDERGPKTLPLDLAVYGRFVAVCRAETLRAIELISEQRKQIAVAISGEGAAAKTFSDFAVAGAEAQSRYDVLPERKVLMKRDTRLFRMIEAVGYNEVRRAMHPMGQELVPFIYYLAALTLYNGQPLMETRLEDIIETTILGTARLSLHSFKTRAKNHQHRSFAITDEADNPANVIRFVREWTSGIREVAPDSARDMLFIFVPRNRKDEALVRPLFDRAAGMSKEFNNHGLRFCKRNDFPYIGTRVLRATGADLAHDVFDGDIVETETVLGHVGPARVHPSYRSAAAKQRDEDRLAGAMAARERWVASGGKSDARTEGANRDRTAATPGFRCLDPYSSPMPGEKKGRLCAAYGFCAACPLGQPDEDGAYALARVLQLKERVLEAKDRHGMVVWNERFAIILEGIDRIWLPGLSDESTLDAAAHLHLNPLPHLE